MKLCAQTFIATAKSTSPGCSHAKIRSTSSFATTTHLRATGSAEVKGPRTGEEKPRLPLRHGSPPPGGF
eukprot:CAMPEP_0184375578 /NCGR_PEP_ID=MMETSP0007-20130409/578_1 /TAXON_ID=97485 /ORGANISM="Prymnesium parvum, Strain Texoma1" /LENGTH=68 /DNA_ID=CAMNT_0026718751 /DNA_START=197 /DNA_END=400 /DNA_ORIENTATION=-